MDRIKELCSAKHVKVYGKSKDALIDQLLGVEFPGEAGGHAAEEEESVSTVQHNGPADVCPINSFPVPPPPTI